MTQEERRELESMLGKLERAELPGDVGRMVYLALENATDERDEAMDPPAEPRRGLRARLSRLLRALSPRRARG